MEGRKECGHYKGKRLKQGLTSAKDLIIEFPEGRGLISVTDKKI